MLGDVGLHPSDEGNNILLQIDIEGDEWSVFKATDPGDWTNFAQIIVEFHFHVSGARVPSNHKMHLQALQNLLQHFTVVHTHGNNWEGEERHGKFHIPSVIEVTYVRNDLAHAGSRCLSSADPQLNRPNNPRAP